MPLTRGRIFGYDSQRMMFKFSMFDGSEDVECHISAAHGSIRRAPTSREHGEHSRPSEPRPIIRRGNQRDWTERKYARWERGERLSSQAVIR
jgi:hypothetical protein